jgi:hypothetical protein
LESEDTTTITENTAQLMAGQETIHQDVMGATNPTWPEGTYDRVVYNDAYFANTRALWDEHPNVLAELLGVMHWPMREIATLEGDLGISRRTNQSRESAAAKRRCVDDDGEEEEDNLLEHE